MDKEKELLVEQVEEIIKKGIQSGKTIDYIKDVYIRDFLKLLKKMYKTI